MKSLRRNQPPSTWAHRACAAAFVTALLLLPLGIIPALAPLIMFLVLCAAAPFFPRYGFYLPVVSSALPGRRAVSVTFDDGPDPDVTPLVLALLQKHGARAVFFMAGNRAEQHPDLVRRVLDAGHSIGNHTYNHTPAVMLKSSQRLRNDVMRAQEIFRQFGLRPLAFRPPAGVTNPKLRGVLEDAGMFCVNFSRRAGDMGNRRIRDLSSKILRRLRDGDIVLLHDTSPPDRSRIPSLIDHFERVVAGIEEKNLSIVPLEELIGRKVMVREP